MNSTQKTLQFIYIILAFTMLIIEIQNLSYLRFIIKPALMPILILFLVVNNKINWKINLAVIALVFSCMGDTFLLFNNPSYFMYGLLAFLMTHICYIIIFLKDIKFNKLLKYKFNFVFVLIILTYIIAFYLSISKNLNSMKIPVLAYMGVISGMVISAFFRKYFVNKHSFLWILSGAVFFIISDSSLAIMKFVNTFPTDNILVIITYMIAQLCIVKGIILNNKLN